MKNRKGIILAGGSGTRLYPLTIAISKQIMPVYDKPMIYYPLSVLMEAKIKDVLIITTPRDNETFKTLLGDGSKWGMNFEYAIQEKPRGLAEAFIIGEKFIGDDNVAMILGDNMFYGEHFAEKLKSANERKNEATIFGYYVKDPRAYGVVEINKEGQAISIEIAKNVKPSARGEIEITTINEEYMNRKQLKVEKLGRGMTWFDTGTHDALIETASFVQTIEKRQGLQICSPDEIAYKNGWITANELSVLADKYIKTEYGQYLKDIALNKFGEE